MVYLKNVTQAAVLAAVLACLPAVAHAAGNLVLNGDFSAQTIGGSASTASAQLSSSATSGPTAYYSGGATLTNWANTAYSFVFTPGAGVSGTTADTSGATINQYGGAGSNPNVYLWGPGAGGGAVSNGLTVSPTGGSFVAGDGAFGGALSQTVNNLTVGDIYNLSFNWAAAQQGGFSGATTEGWQVSFGNSTFTTDTINLASHAFAPWRQQTYSFVATATSQVLSFLAQGTPAGSPPMALLDSVSLTVPEPSSLAVMLAALFAVIGTLSLRAWNVRRMSGGMTV